MSGADAACGPQPGPATAAGRVVPGAPPRRRAARPGRAQARARLTAGKQEGYPEAASLQQRVKQLLRENA
eukprot:2686113-Rhodomonas_salina.2